ncbi:hypothetical protein ASPFODRAFT_72680 [Aspergillus luchuensis CBS 106.47]|uniref:Condensation domain-containing protein n=1 Tax=Aspergillus luchuensis (strain CBS 106.47) TaxID=1137211 RepID=A0A1M3TCD3_ASPLC|nr:hypothetical protein ASPFODRAFT_72680 [Aspergillus luchuensis CBS 106.47]
MSFHYADKGAPRFLQAHGSFVLGEAFDPIQLKKCFQELVHEWPILQARLNLLRTGTFQVSKTHSFFQHRVIDSTLADILPLYPFIHHNVQEDDYNRLKDLTSLPCSTFSILYPPVCTLTAVCLKDASVLKFTFQHAFCDALGMYEIARAYSMLLSGKCIDVPDFHRPVTFRFHASSKTPSSPHHRQGYSPGTLSNASNHLFSGGLSHFTLGLLSHRLAPASWGNTGSSRMLHIPGSVIDGIAHDATKQGIRITRIDIMMALLLQATIRAFPHDSTIASYPLSFMVNFNHLLKSPAKFHNSFWPVPIPQVPDFNANQVSHETTINLAVHIRRVTRAAQSPECLEAFNLQHQQMGPLHLWHTRVVRPSHPRSLVSSIAQINLYDLEFKPGVRPLFSDVRMESIDLAQCIGIHLHGLITINGDPNATGHCLTGSLHPALWRELEWIRDTFLYRSGNAFKSKI